MYEVCHAFAPVDACRLEQSEREGRAVRQEKDHSVSEVLPDRHTISAMRANLLSYSQLISSPKILSISSELGIVHDLPYIGNSHQRGHGRQLKDRAEQRLVLHQFGVERVGDRKSQKDKENDNDYAEITVLIMDARTSDRKHPDVIVQPDPVVSLIQRVPLMEAARYDDDHRMIRKIVI